MTVTLDTTAQMIALAIHEIEEELSASLEGRDRIVWDDLPGKTKQHKVAVIRRLFEMGAVAIPTVTSIAKPIDEADHPTEEQWDALVALGTSIESEALIRGWRLVPGWTSVEERTNWDVSQAKIEDESLSTSVTALEIVYMTNKAPSKGATSKWRRAVKELGSTLGATSTSTVIRYEDGSHTDISL